jgi:hypothetical protein
MSRLELGRSLAPISAETRVNLSLFLEFLVLLANTRLDHHRFHLSPFQFIYLSTLHALATDNVRKTPQNIVTCRPIAK